MDRNDQKMNAASATSAPGYGTHRFGLLAIRKPTAIAATWVQPQGCSTLRNAEEVAEAIEAADGGAEAICVLGMPSSLGVKVPCAT
jgi:hypothetical protein